LKSSQQGEVHEFMFFVSLESSQQGGVHENQEGCMSLIP
jgi:hypothetical protein